MGLKNYTTKVSADRSVQEIQKMLALRGASGFMLEYEKGTGRIETVTFGLELNGRQVGFRLPLRWREVGLAIQNDPSVPGTYSNRARDDEDYVYRVAWRVLRDWVDAQMAMVDIGMVKTEEVFLPYAVNRQGQTLFEAAQSSPQFLLGE